MSLKNLSAKIKIPKLLREKLYIKKIRHIYKKFDKSLNINEDFIVAVSGGPDSLALAFLSKIYSIKNKLKVKFFIVDHKLRSESTGEANKVKKNLKKFNINCEILVWRGKKPIKNIQSIARKKRYKLLFDKCDKLKIKNILLGHHNGDLLENFFIRTFRGSGLKGLISLEKKTVISDKNLFRPLLDQNKEDLIFISKKVFGFYIEDPSNYNDKYQRIKIRKLIDKLENEGLTKKKLLKTITNLKSSNIVIDFYVKQNLSNNSFFHVKNNKLIINRAFFKQPPEVVFRAFAESIKLIGKKYYFVRGKKLDRIISEIGNNKSYKATLGGCIIEKVNQTVILSKEL